MASWPCGGASACNLDVVGPRPSAALLPCDAVDRRHRRGLALLARGRIRTPVALWIARQAAEALQALHTTGYLHGDVKPANLLVDRHGHVTLIDLGCAGRFPDEPTLDDPSLSGTPSYLAPETFVGRPSDRRSDLYSLGITLWEMLAGRLPTMGEDLAAVANFKRQGILPSVPRFRPASSRRGFGPNSPPNRPRTPPPPPNCTRSCARIAVPGNRHAARAGFSVNPLSNYGVQSIGRRQWLPDGSPHVL